MNVVGEGPQGPQVNLADAEDVKCEKCEHDVFVEGLMIKKISKFLTGAARDQISPIPVIACAKCGHVNDEFKPQLNNLAQ